MFILLCLIILLIHDKNIFFRYINITLSYTNNKSFSFCFTVELNYSHFFKGKHNGT